ATVSRGAWPRDDRIRRLSYGPYGDESLERAPADSPAHEPERKGARPPRSRPRRSLRARDRTRGAAAAGPGRPTAAAVLRAAPRGLRRRPPRPLAVGRRRPAVRGRARSPVLQPDGAVRPVRLARLADPERARAVARGRRRAPDDDL